MSCSNCAYYRSTDDGGCCICPRERVIDLKTGSCSQEKDKGNTEEEMRWQ